MWINIDFPVYYFLACVFLGIGYAYFLYRKNKFIKNKNLLICLFIIRTFFVSFLASLLLNPVVKSVHKFIEQPIIIVAQDVSSSITDSSYKSLSDLSDMFEGYDVHRFSFSDDVSLGFSSVNTGLITNYS